MFHKVTIKVSLKYNSGNTNIICKNMILFLFRLLNILFYDITPYMLLTFIASPIRLEKYNEAYIILKF